MLDIGAGNHSASKITTFFPACEYYGLDQSREYNNSEEDFQAMKGFYEMDLTRLEYEPIPDHYFDAIWIVHVIEHLHNGDQVIEKLIPKLKPGGFMYLEYPGAKSKKLPHMYGTLNFYDDPTHVRCYSIGELTQVLTRNQCIVVESGIRRNIYFMLAMPFRILYYLLLGQKVPGNVFWDLLGFAEFLYVKKVV